MPVDFGKRLKEAEDAGLVGNSDYFKLKDGDNRMRLMSECLPHPGEYQGKPNFKWLCYVLDRRDGRIKPFFMAHSIYKQITALQSNEDYTFADVPMPYDLNIIAKGAGTKEVEYTLLPARRETPITNQELAAFYEVKPLDELQKLLREKNSKSSHAEADHAPVRAERLDDMEEPPF